MDGGIAARRARGDGARGVFGGGCGNDVGVCGILLVDVDVDVVVVVKVVVPWGK